MAKDVDDAIRLRLLEIAFASDLQVVAISLAASSSVAVFLWSQGVDPVFLNWWAAYLVVIHVLRVCMHAYCAHSPAQAKTLDTGKVGSWRILNAISLLAGASIWAILTIFLFESLSREALFVVVLVIFAMSTGATGTLASVDWPAKAYFVAMLFPVGGAALWATEPSYLIAFLSVLFCVLNTFFHNSNHAILSKSERLQLQNKDLAKKLDVERLELQQLNEELEERVRGRTAELRYLSEHDSLTGLFNRTGLRHWVDRKLEILAGDMSIAVIFIDLDRFKQVNDSLGHDVGDEVLRQIAARIEKCLPETASACRWGGDEFVIFLPVSSYDALLSGRDLADDLREIVERPVQTKSHVLNVCFSAGVAIAGLDHGQVLGAVRAADLALRDVKRNHRGVTRLFSDDLGKKQERQLLLMQAMGKAIENGEFSIALQPIVNAWTQELEELEVLVRWRNPFLGSVSPVEFIPVAEDTGDIVAIGRHVLDLALYELSQSSFGRQKGRIAVNVSSRQLVEPTWLESVASSLASHGISPEQLIVEVTETAFEDMTAGTVQLTLNALSELGVEVHIDDFGTGYSSLERLQEFPASALKIDRSFVRKIDEGGLAIIEGSILIAKKRGLKTVAEGVETPGQAEQLKELGVDYLQGYLFGKPEAGMDTHFLRPCDQEREA